MFLGFLLGVKEEKEEEEEEEEEGAAAQFVEQRAPHATFFFSFGALEIAWERENHNLPLLYP